MSDCQTFNGVTADIFACVKKESASEHGTVYDPPDANSGTATTSVPIVGKIVVSFDLDPSTNAITYCIVSKPGIVTEGEVFNGISETIAKCGGGS